MTRSRQPLVSIVTPVLDRVSTIEACLASVSVQSYSNVEHIIIDGESTDGTLEILSSRASTGSLRVISEKDSGMYDAINKGLHLANGEILAYLNSDDLYLPWSVEVGVSALLEGHDLVYGDLALFTRDVKGSHCYPQFYRPFDLNHYTHFATLAQPTVFWHRHLTQAIGDFDTSYNLLGDCEYWLRAGASGFDLHHVREILAIQIEHGATLRATHPERLEGEFRKLRANYSKVAGRRRGRAIKGLCRRIRWRRDQFQFAFSSRSPKQNRWPRFAGFLQSEGIGISSSGFFWYLLPRPLRRRWVSLLDADRFEEAISTRIGTRIGP